MVPSIIDSYSPARLPSPQGGPPCFRAAQNFLNQACKRCRPVNDCHEESSFYSQIPRSRRQDSTHTDARGSSSVRQEAEGGEGEMWVGACIVVSKERMGEAGLAGLRLTGLNSFMSCGV